MLDIEKERENFESWYVEISKPYVADLRRLDCDNEADQYFDSALDLGWTVWQHRQSEIDELVGALEYHISQTRPIERSLNVLAKHKPDNGVTTNAAK